ncbi:hypothetical protein GMSM_46570 [Geomonas sp. Red276]
MEAVGWPVIVVDVCPDRFLIVQEMPEPVALPMALHTLCGVHSEIQAFFFCQEARNKDNVLSIVGIIVW